jgi:hypothetical protein
MGILMGRAFREGIEASRKIDTTTPLRKWRPLDRLRGLTTRTKHIERAMGPLVDVPAMIRIEDEKWVFERISAEVISQLSHRLVLHSPRGMKTIGATTDITTAVNVAKKMAETEGKIVLIAPI